MSNTTDTATANRLTDEILHDVNIPSLPEAAVKLLTLCRDEMIGAGELVRVIELDAALTARVMKVANSAAFGQQGRVNTLTSAAVVLGNENLKVAALGFYLSTAWEGFGAGALDIREFWRDAVIRACLARRLAQSSGFQPREEAFLMAMLLDIGTLILGTHFGDKYATLLAGDAGYRAERAELESSALGINHVEIASALCKRWNFPASLNQAVGTQCDCPPCQKPTDPALTLRQIAYFCANVPFATDRQTAQVGMELRNLAYGAFELSFEGLSDVFTDTVEQFNALRTVFARLIPRDCEVETIMGQARNLIESSDVGIND